MSGGPPAALRGLALAQRELGMDVTVVTTRRADQDTTIEEELRSAEAAVHSVGPVHLPLGIHRGIRPILRKAITASDIVHIHGLWEDIQHQAAVEARKQGKPYIIRPCGMLDPWSLRQSAIRKKLYLFWRLRRDLNSASAIHYTATIERDLAKPLGLKPQPIIEPNGLDLSEFETLPPPGTFRNAHPELGDRPYVLFLSRIHPKKGLDLLIPAFAQAAPPDHALVIAGPGEEDYIASIKQLIQQHGLKDRVLFPGMLSGQTKLAAYAEAELFALPSYQENFGIVVIEALASGTPVLISDQVNIWPEIKEAAVGKICQTQIASIAEALKLALTDVPIADSKGCHDFVAEKYDWRKIASRWTQRMEKWIH